MSKLEQALRNFFLAFRHKNQTRKVKRDKGVHWG